ncbi:MAG: hypothetical protein CME06_07455 [Gemmatimonadetes bacterium]|nr:hypothetical protein [Gemmatimonadota bacterium]
MTLHFGLSEATSIDTLRIHWLSGAVATEIDLAADQVLRIAEEGAVGLESERDGAPPLGRPVLSVGPNPFNPRIRVQVSLLRESEIDLRVYDLAGAFVAHSHDP